MRLLIEYIENEMQRQGIDRQTLADRSGIHYSSLTRHLNGKVEDWKVKTVIEFATGLGIDPIKLVRLYEWDKRLSDHYRPADMSLEELLTMYPDAEEMARLIAALPISYRRMAESYLRYLATNAPPDAPAPVKQE